MVSYGNETLYTAFVYDILATLVVFILSFLTNNSTWYDPYWSVSPIVLSAYFSWRSPAVYAPRHILLIFLVVVWGARLTYNWAVGFIRGLGATSEQHEDWRYLMIKQKLNSLGIGYFYWPVGSLLGIHIFPTLLVFMGSGSIYAAMASTAEFNAFDVIGGIIVICGISIETLADEQLRRFTRNRSNREKALLTSGLWRYSRHPNYFGETLFWVGLYLIGTGATADWSKVLYLGAGPVSMVALFNFISIPVMENRQILKRPGYRDYQGKVSKYIPWFSNLD